jgi:hypothetical protein
MLERTIIYASPKPEVELADVFRLHGEEYLQDHGVSCEQSKAMRDIAQCRTATLGGHVDECDHCWTLKISYNS